ncbi:conserved hypothetical protein [Lausannevirus]|uniref:Uncharacterized protein n=2 Tax=Lausannevirus TaxID=999883 RepID=A0A0N7G2D7_9VIRU|nr:hypothetical protein LAU_0163 [Lausannevirus]AEA07014.1 conserved hypothetical protein [Lausannevirus]ALH06840.1 hypothetical protein PMV_142 [Port-miou virus]
MSKKFHEFLQLPYELAEYIVLLSDNANCLLVCHEFHKIWRKRLRERNEKLGMCLLREGAFFGLVLARKSDRMRIVGEVAASGNKRLLKKVLCINKRQCYAYCQENALYGASFANNKKLGLWVRKRFRATCVSGFHGALDGGHEKLCSFWWKKMKRKFTSKKEMQGFLSGAMIRSASKNPKLLGFLSKLGGTPRAGTFAACAEKKDIETFRMLLPQIKEEDKDLVFFYAIKTRVPIFAYACFAFGMEAKNMHIQEASKIQDSMKLVINPVTVA